VRASFVVIVAAAVLRWSYLTGLLTEQVVDVSIAAAAIFAGVLTAIGIIVLILASMYASLIDGNGFDIDAYVADPKPSVLSRAKVVLIHYFINVGGHKASRTALPLAQEESPYVPGLMVTSREGTREGSVPLPPSEAKGGLIVGTIRMGFGHHRIAYAAASWGVASGRTTYFHDLLNIDSPEATLIKEMDKGYSKMSRLATEMGGSVERLWGALTRGADENMLRASYQFGEHLLPLLLSLPKDTPLIATHCFVGLIAVALGFTKVINLVIDNHAQWFIVVPGAYNLVQGPSNYHNLLRMGVPPERLVLAGHWIPKDLVDNIESDCAARVERAKKRAPRRLLIPVGGAGAQKTFVTKFVKSLKSHVEEGKVQLFLNAGDHEHMRVAFTQALAEMGISNYGKVDTMEGVHEFANRLRKGQQPQHAVTLFAFPVYFPAVATTDVLSRVCDVLCCKPSELAFYPVPKFMIRRVGDHEALSAGRASEMGDGTLELREVPDAMAYLKKIDESPALLETMNGCIVKNKAAGIYDGCKRAVELAAELAKSR
jgi:hypothetical protein